MANINVTIRMNRDLKKEADDLFRQLGMSFTTAVTVFAQQAVREKRIPFDISLRQDRAEDATNAEAERISNKFLDENKIAYQELAK